MLRLASALARFITKDPNSPSTSRPSSPAPRKPSIKSKPNWRSASVHADNRTQGYRCPFTATNALTAATKKEIDAYTSSEEIRSSLSIDKITEGKEIEINSKDFNRRSHGIRLENTPKEIVDDAKNPVTFKETGEEVKPTIEHVIPESVPVENPKDSEPTSPDSEGSKRSILKPAFRKTSCTGVLEVYKRRGSLVPSRPRMNSLSHIYGDKLNSMKEKFGTPEKAMLFFGRCFVKFFSNYG